MRAIVDDGIYIDFYNLHADAGFVTFCPNGVSCAYNNSRTEAGDETARAANLQQVADYIDKWSIGNSVIVCKLIEDSPFS